MIFGPDGADTLSAIERLQFADSTIDLDDGNMLAANPDVAAANVNPLDHFLKLGIYEGRSAVNDGVFF